MDDFDEAGDKVIMGLERKSMVISEKDKLVFLSMYVRVCLWLISKCIFGLACLMKKEGDNTYSDNALPESSGEEVHGEEGQEKYSGKEVVNQELRNG